ncbi:hypothetical protein OROGR_014326 [Orobanche gracilis]
MCVEDHNHAVCAPHDIVDQSESNKDDYNSGGGSDKFSVPNMEDTIPIRGRSRREGQVIDIISQEMENRFTKGNTKLLTCIACLDPRNSFSDFDHGKLLRMAELYPNDFSLMDRELLVNQLNNFIFDARSDTSFFEFRDIGELAIKMVKSHRHTK